MENKVEDLKGKVKELNVKIKTIGKVRLVAAVIFAVIFGLNFFYMFLSYGQVSFIVFSYALFEILDCYLDMKLERLRGELSDK